MSHLSPDIQYLMNDEIGSVITEGLSVLERTKPRYPVDFLARWLLNYCSTKINDQSEKENSEKKQALIEKFKKIQESQKKEAEKAKIVQSSLDKVENDFREMLKNHNYHSELIPTELPNFIQKQKNLPGVYIGTLEHPPRKVKDDDEDENAHLEVYQEKRIIYIGASENHKFLIGKQLAPGKGVTYDAFTPIEEEAPQYDADGQEITRKEKEYYKYFPDVTQDTRIFFFRIPKLGSYLCVPLSYKSCLTEDSLDAGVSERRRIAESKAQQQKDYAEAEEAYNKELEEANNAGDTDRIQFIEENWQNKKTSYTDEKEEPFKTHLKQYVLCVDTLGEDREISLEDRKYLDDLAKFFTKSWEESEARQLSQDIDLLIEIGNRENKTEFLNAFNSNQEAEINEKLANKPENEPQSSEDIEFKRGQYMIEYLRKSLLDSQNVEKITELKKFRVIKFKSVIQNALYLVGYKKDEININATNVLNWKHAKTLLDPNHLFSKLEKYQVFGPKTGKFDSYALINRIQKRLNLLNPDEIDDYNIGLGILFRFVKNAVDLRILDIQRRRQEKMAARENRENLIREEENRKALRDEQLEQAKHAYNEFVPDPNDPNQPEDRSPFNQEEFLAKFDQENPEKAIPPVIEDDIDNDFEE